MTARELRDILLTLTEEQLDSAVTIFIPQAAKPEGHHFDDYMAYVAGAKYCKPSGISGNEFEITMGRTFGY